MVHAEYGWFFLNQVFVSDTTYLLDRIYLVTNKLCLKWISWTIVLWNHKVRLNFWLDNDSIIDQLNPVGKLTLLFANRNHAISHKITPNSVATQFYEPIYATVVTIGKIQQDKVWNKSAIIMLCKNVTLILRMVNDTPYQNGCVRTVDNGTVTQGTG